MPNCFVIVCRGAEDVMSLLEEESGCQNPNVWAATTSAYFGSVFNLLGRESMASSLWFCKKTYHWQKGQTVLFDCRLLKMYWHGWAASIGLCRSDSCFHVSYNIIVVIFLTSMPPHQNHLLHVALQKVPPHSDLRLSVRACFLGKHAINLFTLITSCDIFSVSFSTLSSRHPEAILCDVGEFHCHDQETCIPEAWLCDDEPDCPDDSDETDKTCKSLIPFISL